MNAPEKIYGWMDSQLSIARFYGGMTFRGHSYVIDKNDPDHPLVRLDVSKTEKKQKPAIPPSNPNDDKTLELF